MSDQTADRLSGLRKILADRCETDDEAILERFSRDQVGDEACYTRPSAVVSPVSTEEVSLLMRWANETGIPVTRFRRPAGW